MASLPGLITVLALILYFVLTLNVGRARMQYQIQPPKTSGSPEFERVLRVQQNTLEQMVLVLPSMWLFCQFVSSIWGSALGAVWIVGRILYAWGYYQAAEKRFPGFGLGMAATVILLIGALVGIVLSMASSSLA